MHMQWMQPPTGEGRRGGGRGAARPADGLVWASVALSGSAWLSAGLRSAPCGEPSQSWVLRARGRRRRRSPSVCLSVCRAAQCSLRRSPAPWGRARASSRRGVVGSGAVGSGAVGSGVVGCAALLAVVPVALCGRGGMVVVWALVASQHAATDHLVG